MPWISKYRLQDMQAQIHDMEDTFTRVQSLYLKAQREVVALNKAAKNKSKLKTALRAANKKLDEFEQERFNTIHYIESVSAG